MKKRAIAAMLAGVITLGAGCSVNVNLEINDSKTGTTESSGNNGGGDDVTVSTGNDFIDNFWDNLLNRPSEPVGDEITMLAELGLICNNGEVIGRDEKMTSGSYKGAAIGTGAVMASGKLYYDGKRITFGEDAEFRPESTMFSMNGKAAVLYYTKDYKKPMFVDLRENKVLKLPENTSSMTVSPDGKTCAYTIKNEGIYATDIDGNTRTLIDEDSGLEKFISLGVGAISNDAKYIYYGGKTKESPSVLCIKTPEKIIKHENVNSNFFFNSSNTQILYSEKSDEGNKFICYDAVHDTECYSFISPSAGSTIMPVTERNLAPCYGMDSKQTMGIMNNCAFFNVLDLKNTILYDTMGKRCIFSVDNGKVTQLSEDVVFARVGGDNKTVYYLKKGDEKKELYMVSAEKAATKVVDCEMFGLSKSGVKLYFTTKDDELFVADAAGGNLKKIGNMKHESYMNGLKQMGGKTPLIVGDNVIIYENTDGKYVVNNNGEETEIYGVDLLRLGSTSLSCLYSNFAQTKNASAIPATNAAYFWKSDDSDNDSPIYSIDAYGKIKELK